MWWNTHSNQISSFGRNGRVHLNRRGRQFSRLLVAEVCASALVMLDTPCSEVVWRVLATHPIRQFPLHFPSRASPCAITFQLDCTNISSHTQWFYYLLYPVTLNKDSLSNQISYFARLSKWCLIIVRISIYIEVICHFLCHLLVNSNFIFVRASWGLALLIVDQITHNQTTHTAGRILLNEWSDPRRGCCFHNK
jgi:hypothetical protein